MFGMSDADSFNAKVVNNQTECDRAPFVVPEALCELTLVITMCVQAAGKKFVSEESCLWEAVHPFFYADIYPTIEDFLSMAVFGYDFFECRI